MASMSLTGAAGVHQMFESARAWADDTVWIVGTHVEYAAYVELGTANQEAQPYLFAAAKKVGRNPGRYIDDPDSVEEFVKQVAQAIEREAKKRCPVDTGNLKASITAQEVG